MHSDMQLRHLTESLQPHQIMLGSDYPFDMGSEDPVGQITRSGLPPEMTEAILSRNASALFNIEER